MENKIYLHENFSKIKNELFKEQLEINSLNSYGMVLTLFLSKAEEKSIDISEVVEAVRGLSNELENYTFQIDGFLKDLIKKDQFNKDDVMLIKHMVLLKIKSAEIKGFVGLLAENNPSDYKKLVDLSSRFVSNVQEFYSITLMFDDIDTAEIELSFDNVRAALASMLDKFKNYIIENYRQYLSSENCECRTYQLGYMLQTIGIVEYIVQGFPLYDTLNIKRPEISASIYTVLVE